MPNWCNASVIVSAKTEAEIVEFLDFCDQRHTSHWKDWKSNEVVVDEDTKGVFWNFITPTDLESYFSSSTTPRPEGVNIMEQIAKEFAEGMDWYNWNVRNWGTKWDVQLNREEINIDQNNDGEFYFHWNLETAWSPAVHAYRAMAERFPNLEFNYEITEEANFYAGILVYSNGELIREEWVDEPTHHDYERLDIPCPECNWVDEGICLDREDEDVLELEPTTTNN